MQQVRLGEEGNTKIHTHRVTRKGTGSLFAKSVSWDIKGLFARSTGAHSTAGFSQSPTLTSLKNYKGFLCYTETRWELGAVCFIMWLLMLEEVAARNRHSLISKPLIF